VGFQGKKREARRAFLREIRLSAQGRFQRGRTMTFLIKGLDPRPFLDLYELPEAELAKRQVQRMVVDVHPGFPDRVEIRDAAPGQTVLLLNFEHLPVANPYRSRHAIFVREGATEAFIGRNEVPPALRARTISLRAFDRDDLMVDADLVDGQEIETLIERLLARADVQYLHAHYAKRGCYAARIERAGEHAN
jgi:hypothetical protein